MLKNNRSVYAVFHLNLAFSSISLSRHEEVIDKCYFPILDLIDRDGFPLGVELTSWTLKRIFELRPKWVERFKTLLGEKKCELIGSGYTQSIGPLIPFDVNLWNQEIGLKDYNEILKCRPRIALVNEMAFSKGLVEVYQRNRYLGIIMDRDNIQLALTDDFELGAGVLAADDRGHSLPMLWSDSILFQKIQRYAHGDITRLDYKQYVESRFEKQNFPLPLYCNDAETFDFRPGRFKQESELLSNEWQRVRTCFSLARDELGAKWLSPSEALNEIYSKSKACTAKVLTTAAQPIPVKKQTKYNISRWAISGRDDLWLNSFCYRAFDEIKHRHPENDAFRRKLLELWASDLRTHVTDDKWTIAQSDAAQLASELDIPLGSSDELTKVNATQISLPTDSQNIYLDEEQVYLHIKTRSVEAKLNLRRGLTVHSLSFEKHKFIPCIGTLPHGYFDSIRFGADWFSCGSIIELPLEHRRVADLDWVKPRFFENETAFYVEGDIKTSLGVIRKRIGLFKEVQKLSFEIAFPNWTKPNGVIRVGEITLLSHSKNLGLFYRVSNGGSHSESFEMESAFMHTNLASSLVSCSMGLGATTGELTFGPKNAPIKVSWDPAKTAAFPMFEHQPAKPGHLTRVVFSLGEMDETRRPGGVLPGFYYEIEPSEWNSSNG